MSSEQSEATLRLEIENKVLKDILSRLGAGLPLTAGTPAVSTVQPAVNSPPAQPEKKPARKRQPRQMVGPNKCRCPRCKKVKAFPDDFGHANVRGKEIVLSWCKACRSETAKDYRNSPRKYNVKP